MAPWRRLREVVARARPREGIFSLGGGGPMRHSPFLLSLSVGCRVVVGFALIPHTTWTILGSPNLGSGGEGTHRPPGSVFFSFWFFMFSFLLRDDPRAGFTRILPTHLLVARWNPLLRAHGLRAVRASHPTPGVDSHSSHCDVRSNDTEGNTLGRSGYGRA
ncbi:hypothetical protein LY76DRAFT_180435 [Colletotrichum caudatum]|nr:hypothetical protein LY76DRAFT_180435 [Colletotrichum caudatum]